MSRKIFSLRRAVALAIALLSTGGVAATGHLVLVGGGQLPPQALAKFVEWAGNTRAVILVISWAGGAPGISFQRFRDTLLPYHPARVVEAPTLAQMPAQRALFLEELHQATGVFFTGGKQNRVMDELRDRGLLDEIRQRYRQGAVFGGTSAGTAIMSAQMLTGGGDRTVVDPQAVETREGLGLLGNALVDQHFLKRQRENRLFSFLEKTHFPLGIGIDQSTAIAVEDERWVRVYGATQILVVEAGNEDGKFDVQFVKAGEGYDLVGRSKTP